MKCNVCGNYLNKGETKCPLCGADLSDTAKSGEKVAESGAPATSAEKPAVKQEEWFIHSAGKNFGPYSKKQLLGFIKELRVVTTTMVWREGFAGWVKAGETREFAEMMEMLEDAGSLRQEKEDGKKKQATVDETPEERKERISKEKEMSRRVKEAAKKEKKKQKKKKREERMSAKKYMSELEDRMGKKKARSRKFRKMGFIGKVIDWVLTLSPW